VDGLQPAVVIVARMTGASQGRPAVVIREPGRSPLRLLVTGPAIEVGRDCRGVLLTDPQISRRHLSLREVDGTVCVTDLGSTNGTRVDGAPIAGDHTLAPGEVVQLGTTTIALLTETPAAAAHAARSTSIDLVAAAAVADPPDFAALPADGGTLTIVFSDIEHSTRRAVEVGDVRWMELLELHNSIVRRQVTRHRGTEIKAQGDGFMLSFPSARRALACMVDVQRALHALARSRPADGLRVRVGVHTGEVIVGDDGDLFGRHVVIASRVADAARGGEILVSGLVRELVEPRGDFTFGAPRLATLKGLGPDHPVHPVAWDQDRPIDPTPEGEPE
jgi:class 3 adenylate cyclase